MGRESTSIWQIQIQRQKLPDIIGVAKMSVSGEADVKGIVRLVESEFGGFF